MATKDLTSSNFQQEIESEGIVLLDFWAEWCGPCRIFGPIFESVSEDHPDVTFGKVDTEAEPQLAATFNITSIPTLMAFRDGVLVFSQPGVVPADQLEGLISGVKALDMDEVRSQMKEQGKA